jgi:DNA-binding transcriptional LysR family regulator
MPSIMDSRFLETLVRVVELGSIAEAARRLDLTPPTVAQRLRALEAEVGSPLVTRAGRTVKPTVAGARVMEHAGVVLREIRDLMSAASGTDLPAGPLRLGATPTVMTGTLPAVLKAWVKHHPQIEVYIEPAPTALLHERVLRGELDAAILVHPAYELPKTVMWHTLREEPLVLVTPTTMRVRDALATIASEPFIRYDRNVIAGRLADDYLRKRNVRPKVRFELDGIENITRLVSEGLGVSVLPDWPGAGTNCPVRKWPLPAPCPSRTVGIMWQRSGVRAPLVSAFVALT